MSNPAPGDTGSRGWGPPFPADRLSNSAMVHGSPPMFATLLSHITNSVVKRENKNKYWNITMHQCALNMYYVHRANSSSRNTHTLVTHWSSVTDVGTRKQNKLPSCIRRARTLPEMNLKITEPWRNVPYYKCRINPNQVRRWHFTHNQGKTGWCSEYQILRLNMFK